MLDVQRRMHPSIAAFPARAFYSDNIRSANCSWDEVEVEGARWPSGHRVLCVDCDGYEERRGQSSFNREEALAIAALAPRIHAMEEDIGVITPYLAQKRMILDLLAEQGLRRIKVDTVDGFQGSEREVILVSTVRSNDKGTLGFLSDFRRMNVALTRAKRGLILFGNIATLEAYGDGVQQRDQYDDRSFWRRWVKWCRQTDLLLKLRDLRL